MNCSRCTMPLEANARFCRNCGLPVTRQASMPETNANSDSGNASPSPLYRPVSSNAETSTIPPTPWQAPSNPPQQPLYLRGQQGQSVPASSAATPQAQQWQQVRQQQNQQQVWRPASAQPPYIQSDRLSDAGTMRSGKPVQPQRKRRGRGLLIGFVIFIVLIVALLIGARFILRAYALNKMNQTFSDTINTIPSAVALLPDRDQTFTESQVNTAMSGRISASSPVQDVTVHFTPNAVEVDFNVFAFPSTITMVPKVVNGQLVATNVTVQGIVGLILSSDDISNVVNAQIIHLETHIQHTITAITLQNQAIVLHLKRGLSTPSTLPTTVPGSLPTLPSGP